MQIPSFQKLDTFDTIMVSKRDRPVVKFVIMFPFGAEVDPHNQQGLTNITGDMLLRGTKSLTRTEIENKLDELGASLSIYTGFHSVSIEGQILKRNFPELLRIIQTILSESTFDEDELEKLKNEITSQLRHRLDDDQGLAKTAFNREMFVGHTYAQEVMGNEKTLSSITKENVETHFKTYFSSKQVLIGLSGDTSNAMLDLCVMTIKRSLPTNDIPQPNAASMNFPKGKILLFVDKPERTQTHFFIGHPTMSMLDPHAFDFLVYQTAFSGGLFQAKYMQEIRVKRGWAYGAYGSVDYRKYASTSYLYTFPKNVDTADAISTSLDLYAQAREGTILSTSDIEFAKHYLYRSFPFKIDTPGKILSQKIHQKHLGLPEDYIETYRHHIEAVQADNIHNRISDFFTKQDFLISVLGSKDTLLDQLVERLKPDQVKVISFEELI
ncbi:MAG: insulinase family protein [Bdellovibrionales bacterium]|nr:insulinase family protein [Bdellovibrionales bacterium]